MLFEVVEDCVARFTYWAEVVCAATGAQGKDTVKLYLLDFIYTRE